MLHHFRYFHTPCSFILLLITFLCRCLYGAWYPSLDAAAGVETMTARSVKHLIFAFNISVEAEDNGSLYNLSKLHVIMVVHYCVFFSQMSHTFVNVWVQYLEVEINNLFALVQNVCVCSSLHNHLQSRHKLMSFKLQL